MKLFSRCYVSTYKEIKKNYKDLQIIFQKTINIVGINFWDEMTEMSFQPKIYISRIKFNAEFIITINLAALYLKKELNTQFWGMGWIWSHLDNIISVYYPTDP